MRKLVFMFLIGMSLLIFNACGGQTQQSSEAMDHAEATEQTSDTTAVHGKGKEYTSAYVCPMHCAGSGSEEPGKCPVCGMDYVAQNDHVKDGHSHQD